MTRSGDCDLNMSYGPGIHESEENEGFMEIHEKHVSEGRVHCSSRHITSCSLLGTPPVIVRGHLRQANEGGLANACRTPCCRAGCSLALTPRLVFSKSMAATIMPRMT